MRLFHLDPVAVDSRYYAVDVAVACGSELMFGEPAKPIMAEDDEEFLELEMDEDTGGLEPSDYVTNPDGILPLSKAFVDAIVESFELGEYEVLPARLINEKGRVHSEEYVVLNPLGLHDCLNVAASDMDGSQNDPSVEIMGKWCLHHDKIPALDLFRVRCVDGYVFSERLVKFIESGGYKNFTFNPVTIC